MNDSHRETTSPNDDLFDARLGLGLRELDGQETPPDVTERVLAGTPSRVASRQRTTHGLAAVLVVALGLATAVGVWMSNRPEGDSGDSPTPIAPQQDPYPKLPPPVTVRSPLDIVKLPVSTAHVHGFDLSRDDLRALQRVSGLRGLILRWSRFEPGLLTELARLDKLEQVVIESELDAKHASALAALRSLPRLRSLAVAFEEIDDRVLGAIGKAKKLQAIEFRGEMVCTPKGMTDFAKSLRRLRAFGIDTIRDSGAGLGEPRTPPGVWDVLPASLVELKLQNQSVKTDALRRLPGLKKLDLYRSYSVGSELLQIANMWRDSAIITPAGFRLSVDKKGRCTPQATRVVMIQRRDNGAYQAAAYSFRHHSGDVADHNNDVDLVFNGCGNVHINPHGDSANRVLDLGKTDVVPAPDKLPKEGWLEDSFRPVAGHRFVQEVARRGRGVAAGKMLVQFHIVKAEGNRVWLEWRHCDAEQMWKLAAPKPQGRAGTMGQCGPHRAR